MADYAEAAQYAGMAEELSRTVEYLQILSAGAVDHTRTQAISAAATARSRSGRTWITGWDNGTETLNETDTAWPATTTTETDTAWPATTTTETTATDTTAADGITAPATAGAVPARTVPPSPADDGCKNTEEFLRITLRIGISEARRRLHLAHCVLPATTLTGDTTPPIREHLATALAPTTSTTPDNETDTSPDTSTGTDSEMDPYADGSGPGVSVAGPAVSSRAGTIISLTLNRLQHQSTPETLTRIEHDLTRTAATADPDFLTRVARRWADTLDADGTEPSEETLRHTQGAFIRKPRHGLHHLEIFATTDQYEHLLTVMNTATNPRTTSPDTSRADTSANTDADTGPGAGAGGIWQDNEIDLDRRTRSQKQLDGIIGAVKAGLSTNTLPTTGGNRPQIIATINYQDLFPHPDTDTAPEETATGTGNFVFTGPVAATTLRKIACDADIIPALLGTHSEILDLGRKTRLFTPAQRTALTARDQGCTFPNCTTPAPWCEAHHITYWSHDGPTNLGNGALLCTHHHHLVHKEQWTITTQNGVPWYTPPPHIDPTQKPQQNHYFKPPPPPRE
ncbi:HNH endonuclease [Arthrobacter sp. S39]|nr:HNH endonuclease [Arthrobacter sp. S39]